MKAGRIICLMVIMLHGFVLVGQTKYVTEYEVHYEISYSLDSLNLENKKQEKTFLFTGAEYGVFLNSNDANAEFIKKEISRMMKAGFVNMSGLVIETDFPKQFYKNKKEAQVLVISNIGDSYLSYTEGKTAFVWKITQETKEFMGFQTQKATTSFGGRDFVAWFTLEIPISDGPYIFYGLPGLIVQLYDTKEHYVFEMSSIEKLETSKVWTPPKALKMTKKKYLENLAQQAKDYSMEGIINRTSAFTPNTMMSSTVTRRDETGKMMTQEEYKRWLREYEKSRNNPIELN